MVHPASWNWDDSALIEAYDEGLKENLKRGSAKEKAVSFSKKQVSNKKNKSRQWKVGDFCRAVYYADGLVYEAKIIDISDSEYCTIEFLGYEEAIGDIELASLTKSHGKKARKAQMKDAQGFENADVEIESSASESPVVRSGRKHHRNHNISYGETDTTYAAEVSYNKEHPMTVYNEVPANMIPPPPIPPSLAQNPSLCAMLISWYQAGYYAGVHQAKEEAQNRKCHHCCHSAQNRCH